MGVKLFFYPSGISFSGNLSLPLPLSGCALILDKHSKVYKWKTVNLYGKNHWKMKLKEILHTVVTQNGMGFGAEPATPLSS